MIVVAGEALIDLAPRDGLLLPLPGGSPYNVSVGLGRLGCEAAFLGGLSRDGFGHMLAERLAAEGANLDLAPRTDDPTTLAVVHLDHQARASYRFYLDGTSAPALTREQTASLPAGAALHVSFGAVSMDTPTAGPTLVDLLATERDHRLTSLDPNVRPSVIDDLADYAARMDALVTDVDLVKVSDEDLHLLHPDTPPLEVARRWAGSGPVLVVVTRGPDGSIAFRPDGGHVEVSGEHVEVLDTVGAGDAFTSGLLAWLERHDHLSHGALTAIGDDALTEALRQAVHVAAITCTRAGSDPPRLAEL